MFQTNWKNISNLRKNVSREKESQISKYGKKLFIFSFQRCLHLYDAWFAGAGAGGGRADRPPTLPGDAGQG